MECQNCGHKFFLQGQSGDMVQDGTCPNCHEPYLNQPSPTHSEMELRDMPAPGEQDMGGNPLQEGVLADGGWQNRMKRDESFASVQKQAWDDSDMEDWGADEPQMTHKFIVLPNGDVHSSPTNGDDTSVYHEDIARELGDESLGTLNGGSTLGALFNDGTTKWYGNGGRLAADRLSQALGQHFGHEVHVDPNDPNLKVTSDEGRWLQPGQKFNPNDPEAWGRQFPEGTAMGDEYALQKQQEQEALKSLKKKQFNYYDNPFFNRGGSTLDRYHAEPSWLVSSDEDLAKEAAFLEPALPLVGRALMAHGIANGVGGLMKGVMGGGASQAPQEQAGQELPDEYLSHTAGPLDHPSSIPELGAQENDPESADQHEVNDGDTTNPYGSDVNGVGGADQGSDLILSPETEHKIEMLLPLLIEYYNSPQSGKDDPLIKALHEAIEQENPGYLDSHTAAGPAMPPVGGQPSPGMAMVPQTPSTPPNAPTNPVSQGHCAYCGATMNPGDAQCPQCGAGTAGGGVMPQQGQPQAQPGLVPNQGAPNYYGHRVAQDPNMVGSPDATMMPPEGAPPADPTMMGPMPAPPPPPGSGGTQGPQTKEQFAAVAQLLVDQDRADEIPNMLQNPDDFSDELAQVQQKQPVPQDIQGEQPDPTQQETQAPQMMPPTMGHTAADNIAPRCPECHSGTTALMSEDGICGCHACGHQWKKEMVKAAEHHEHQELHPNTPGIPVADQEMQEDPERNQDSSHHWVDDNGAPLQVGSEYEMWSNNYDIPDIVRIEEVKPDAIDYTITGEYNLDHRTEVTVEEAQLDGLSFRPLGQPDDQQSEAEPDTDSYRGEPWGQSDLSKPALSHRNSVAGPDALRYIETDIPPGVTLPDYRRDRQLENAPVDVCPQCGRDGLQPGRPCPHCGSSAVVAKEAAMSTCGGCGGTRISIGPNGQPRCMQCGSFQILDTRPPAVPNDLPSMQSQPGFQPRGSAEWLDDGSWSKEAGKKFTPMEQREFIDESGEARNRDKLDLKGTHYESKSELEDYFLFGL